MKNKQDWEKFRAWDKKNRKMYFYTFDELLEGKIYTYPDCLDYEWSKFIRLKDKNKVEIYGGDILYKAHTPYGGYENNGGQYKVVEYRLNKYENGYNVRYPLNGAMLWEVVGNIYENPELLEEGNEKTRK